LKESDIKLDETKNKLTSIEIERDNLRSELDSHKIEKSKSLIIQRWVIVLFSIPSTSSSINIFIFVYHKCKYK
jgi:hypothetical protein